MKPVQELYHNIERKVIVKPFLKWAGGKTQLLEQFEHYYPKELKEGKITRYIEPFVGSGAVFFRLVNHFKFKEVFLYDINEDLVHTYNVIKLDVLNLIKELEKLKRKYIKLDELDRKQYYLEIRQNYNNIKAKMKFDSLNGSSTSLASKMIFLNKTCFNGLFRLNSKGAFNVPFGSYKNPKILDEVNLINVSKMLKNVTIEAKDFSTIKRKVTKNSFVYFDPPYRPITKTASFTSYSKNRFNDEDQIRLAQLFEELDPKGAKLMLSNSDPKNENSNDNFFEVYYKRYKKNINRVSARRMINCNAEKRGTIKELIITNY